ncbi:MAG: zinc-ribbon domain-containing protein [Bacteroidota bacterium]
MNQSKRNRSKLADKNPDLSKEWHPTRNGDLRPTDVFPQSDKKVWWVCKKQHEWEAVIGSRDRGNGCPYCSGQKADKTTCLSAVNPKLTKEWHPSNNGKLQPSDVLPQSNKKVWWKCKKGHEWKASVGNRNRGRGCIVCLGTVVTDEINLHKVNLKLATQWHPTKNGSITPGQVHPGSNKSAWWICSKSHEWQARIAHRNNGGDCPICSPQTSKPELRIFAEFKSLFPDVQLRNKIQGIEVDIYLPTLNIGIEYDGSCWHKDKHEKDQIKHRKLSELGVLMFNVRDKRLKQIAKTDVTYSENKDDSEIVFDLVAQIIESANLPEEDKIKLEKYVKEKKTINEEEYMNLVSILPLPLPGTSLADNNKTLAKEWHPNKNGELAPDMFSQSSAEKVWWLCVKRHEWKASISNRNAGRGCPYCSNKKVDKSNCLLTKNPELASEWHSSKNGKLKPNEVLPGSDIKAWWACPQKHEWESRIGDRNRGSGCPYCGHKLAHEPTCLETVNPKLSKDWHPIKNNELTPKDVLPQSNKKVWWKCKNGHEWEARITDRNGGHKCPHCSGKKLNAETCLEGVNPKLAKEWNDTKNGILSPKDVFANAHRKVWWKCNKEHEWEALIDSRNQGRGCPYCTGKLVDKSNCLKTLLFCAV